MQSNRYHRQTLLEGFTPSAQERLTASSVLIAGVGALGCASADLLARAGVGRIVLVDRDVVELTNLQRQVLYTEDDARRSLPKVDAAKERLASVNSSIRIDAWSDQLDGESIESYARGVDAIVDGLDNMEGRNLINEWCVRESIPYFYAAAVGWEGRAMSCVPGGACLRCVYPDAPSPGVLQTCDTAGVFGPVVVRAAAHAAGECIKWLAGMRDAVDCRLIAFDGRTGVTRAIGPHEKDPECVCCAQRNFEFLNAGRQSRTTVLCGRGSVQVLPVGAGGNEIRDRSRLVDALNYHGTFSVGQGGTIEGVLFSEIADTDSAARAHGKTTLGLVLFPDGRVIVQGTVDETRARKIVAKYIGV
ncbi:MAG: ThiF family adenylyltransferase [Planctomycetota bacterium]|nr:ThiF family adenylyltransferase [Planctomycetota bacterium]